VMEVTDDKSMPKLERKRLQASKISSKSMGARLVKIADKWSNTRDLLEDAPEGWTTLLVNGYIAWSNQVCLNAMAPKDIPIQVKHAIMLHFDDLGAYEMDKAILDAYYDSMREK